MSVLKATLLLTLVVLLFACEQPIKWYGSDVTGMLPDLAFSLTDSQGETVTAHDLKGKPLLLFFGFTHCPDVCPTTLAQLKVVMHKLGPEADNIRIALVTVDPERDTPEVMQQYTMTFGPWLLGLTGPEPALATLRQTYGVYAAMQTSDSEGSYNVMHTPIVFAFDAEGHIRLLIKDASNTHAVVSDIRNLIRR